MKKRKNHKTKSSSKKPNDRSVAGLPEKKKAGREAVTHKEEPRSVPAKKDVNKKGESAVSTPKRFYGIARQFIADAKMELKKVTWPTKKELLSTTAVVIILVLLVSFYLGIVDFGLVKIMKSVIG
ncbi:MAG: preprotein translocase subunit SecE [Deltaproteobacteria bacterium]|nr:preprotein translocase subunit SecE [Deltaproteobacteria bacterium]